MHDVVDRLIKRVPVEYGVLLGFLIMMKLKQGGLFFVSKPSVVINSDDKVIIASGSYEDIVEQLRGMGIGYRKMVFLERDQVTDDKSVCTALIGKWTKHGRAGVPSGF